MKNKLVELVKFITPGLLLKVLQKGINKKRLRQWRKNPPVYPPPHYLKQLVIDEYRQLHGVATFIETGTYLGEMVEAQKNNFRKIISIELSTELFKNARERFRNDAHVEIINGDSGAKLGEVIQANPGPAMFWLDGHYSGGQTAKGELNCPVYKELDAIFAHGLHGHVILIDDARLFTGEFDYPHLDELRTFLRQKAPGCTFDVRDDIIRCVI